MDYGAIRKAAELSVLMIAGLFLIPQKASTQAH